MGDPVSAAVPASRAALLRARARSPVMVGVAGKAAEVATLVVLTLLVPRALGAVAFGTFSVALSIVTIAATAMSVGGSSLLSRVVPAAADGERHALARALVERLLRARALQALGVLAIAVAVATLAPGRLGWVGVLLVGAAVVLEVGAALAYQASLGLGHTTLWSFRYPLQNTVLCMAVLGLFAVAGVDGALAGLVLASATAFLLGAAVAGRELRGAQRGATIPDGAIRFGILLGVGGLLTQVSYRGAPVAAALFGVPAAEVGYAALASGVAVAIVYTVWQAFVVDLPHVSAMARDRPAAAEARVRRLAMSATVVLAPTAIVGVSLVGWALPLLLGDEWADAAPSFTPALATLPLAAAAALVTQVSALRMRADVRVLSAVAGVVAFLATSVAAVPTLGAPGAAAALLAAVATVVAVGAVRLEGAHGPRLLLLAYGGAALTLVVGLA